MRYSTPAPMNLAIVHGLLALLALQRQDAAAMAAHNHRARQQAQRGDFRRGLALADLVDAVAAAWSQDATQARTLLARGLAAFAEQGIAESLNHRLAAETWLALGEPACGPRRGRRSAAPGRRLSRGTASGPGAVTACHWRGRRAPAKVASIATLNATKMDYDQFLDQAWTDHATDAPAVAARLAEQALAYVTDTARVIPMAHLAHHVFGEHLGQWATRAWLSWTAWPRCRRCRAKPRKPCCASRRR
jgi:hypothetical protein